MRKQRTEDGLTLHLRDWPAARPRARLLLVHGLGEHSGRYDRLARELAAAGIAVRGYDQRGHGRSEGGRGRLGRCGDALVRDLAGVFARYREEGDGLPFLLGHSMGGLVAAYAVCAGGLRPRGLVLSAPALASHATRAQRVLATVAARSWPGLTLSNGLPLDWLSHAPQAAPEYAEDPLNHDRISARLADFIFRAGPGVIAAAPGLPVPTLLQVAGADRLVDPAGARAFAAAAPAARLTVHEYPELYHEIYNEAEPARRQVIDDLLAWLDRRIVAPGG
ncbi:alpha/beta fold hydrolase [Coralloluteibacterium stylophorae]|uniref:Alpha/beta fold hydrolase n=1 Tax=Coralloluteibacterium stylophorae TaxID=1776034 RepID=A0A8J7VVY7_9GAMM|nr:alpha/beta fold hydrolase [Coralloluteibacterium stylophorae]MBS7458976.1 alpha/beta fold hydrolase [Coralloluteibacterium stylophorae]